MALQTSRLTLRPWRAADADRVLDLYRRLEVVRWLGDGPPRPMESLAQARAAIDRWADRSGTPPLGFWAVEVRETGVLAGTVLLAELPDHPPPQEQPLHDVPLPGREVEVGWHFHPDSWGHGYATEAADALLAHGFAGGLPTIWAVTHLGNAASIRVCERLGMRHRGREQQWYDVPMEVFSLTAVQHAERREA